MFDKHHHHHSHNRHVSVSKTVTEKRAPTDESVKLLKEMEGAARDKILDSVRLDKNDPLQAVIHYEDNPMNASRGYLIQFYLDGRQEVLVRVGREQNDFDEVRKAISSKVASIIMQEGSDNYLKKFFSEQINR